MTFLITLAATCLFVFICKSLIRKAPYAFYALAVVVVIVFFAGEFIVYPRPVHDVVFLLVQRCNLALALFVIVMFVGVFPRDSFIGRWLRPIRAQLSIIACIVSLGHMVVYVLTYLPRIGIAIPTNVIVSLIMAVVLFILLILLGVTSFDAVKKRMTAESWKKIQKLAYPFFGLVYIHLMAMLLPAALKGGKAAVLSVAVYSVVFIGYGMLRVIRALLDSRKKAEETVL